jgi:uncharacterized surface protein with fasciclin (FAS1) repeats
MRITKPLTVALVGLALASTGCGGNSGSGSAAADRSPSEPASPTPAFGPGDFQEGSVPDMLASDGRFTTVLRILSKQMPGFLEFMSGPEFSHTFFAPTDEAFEALPAGTVEALLDERNLSELTPLFRSHILQYRLPSKEFATGPLRMAHGATVLKMSVKGSTVTIGSATVVGAEIEATNGIIHAIDRVLGLDLIELE